MANGSRRNYTREQLAYLAARIMAQDGVNDFAAAKRKAARQAGMTDSKQLPDNREIEEALRTYQALYQSEAQGEALLRLRRLAVQAMELLAPFNPHLLGPVLAGTAGEHSDIDLQLFSDSDKDLELFLLNRRITYQSGSRKIRWGDRQRTVPFFSLPLEGALVNVTLLATDDLRVSQKHKSDGRPVERAKLAQVKALLEATVVPGRPAP
jgi:hypothetical protein